MAGLPTRLSPRPSRLPTSSSNTNRSEDSMLVLDENVPADQRHSLRKWRIRFRVIGVDVAAWGTTDENLIPALHGLPRPTFFTLDQNFYRRDWVHRGYCLVWLDVADDRAAE